VFKTEPLYPPSQGDEADPGFMQSLIAFFTKLWSPATNQAEQLGYAYVYEEQGTLISEVGSGGTNSAGQSQYIYLPTANGPMPIAAVINGNTYAVHSDHLNTPRKLTDANGQAAWQWSYSAFGEDKPTLAKNRFGNLETTPNPGTTSISEVKFNLRYPGQYADEESGLSYNYFRSYDARTGRYSQPDPIGLEGGWNRFGYVSANPLSFSDPTGLAMVERPGNLIPLEGGGGGLSLGAIGAGIAAAIGLNSVGPVPSAPAANDSTYDNVVPLPPPSCPPDDGCKREQDQLLKNRLLISGLWSQGLLGNMGEYRRFVTEFNRKADAHNARCPVHPVARMPLGPF
jgi:RHS repeat-associated protein